MAHACACTRYYDILLQYFVVTSSKLAVDMKKLKFDDSFSKINEETDYSHFIVSLYQVGFT